jgi:hypothetical protein
MAGGSRRRGRLSRGCSAIGLAALALILAGPASAGAAVLDGKTRIRDVDALTIQKGHDRGSVLIWVRVTHARPGLDAQSRASSDASHKGRAIVTVRGERQSTRLQFLGPAALTPPFDSGHLDHAYSLRIKPGTVRRLGIGSAPRLPLRVRAIQRLDLDGDGEAEAARSDFDSELVKTRAVDKAIAPPNGRYELSGSEGRLFMEVGSGAVRAVGGEYRSGGLNCMVSSDINAPIDPVTGEFSYHDPGPREPVTLTGSFSGARATAGGSATGSVPFPSRPCPAFPVPDGSVFAPQ